MVVLVQKENALLNIVFVQKKVYHVQIYVNAQIVIIINQLSVNKFKDLWYQIKKDVNAKKIFV